MSSSSSSLPLSSNHLLEEDDVYEDTSNMLELMDLYVHLNAQIEEIAPYLLPFQLPLAIPFNHLKFLLFFLFPHILCII